jgi:hypothetical protein
MSMTLSFTRVTPDQLDQAHRAPEWAEEYLYEQEDLPRCYLDKAWAGIQFLLNAAEVNVDVYDDGDAIDEQCTLLGWDAGMVAAAAKELAATPFDTLAVHYDPAAMNARDVYPRVWAEGTDDGWLRDNYEALVAFFVETAAAGGAAIRLFSF